MIGHVIDRKTEAITSSPEGPNVLQNKKQKMAECQTKAGNQECFDKLEKLKT